MSRNGYQKEEFIMGEELKERIKEAQVAFDTLKTFTKQVKDIPKAGMNVENVKEAKESNRQDYGRGYQRNKMEDEEYASVAKEGAVEYRGCCKPPVQGYPCKCRRCDQLREAAFRDFLLSAYAIDQLWVTLETAFEQFSDAVEFLNSGLEEQAEAKACARKYNCGHYCRPEKECK